MLCKKCGTENPDGAKYCSKCGKALNEKSTAKKNREKGIVLALCVIVAVVLLVYTLGGRSYKKTIDTFVTSQFAVDAQSIVELFPEKVLDKELVVVDAIKFDTNKTKEMTNLLEVLGLTNHKVLVCVKELTDNVCLAARNLANVKVVMPNEVNTYDLVSSDNLLIEEEALTALEEVLK